DTVVVPFLSVVFGETPEHLPAGRRQAGDRHLNSHKTRDNLGSGSPLYLEELPGRGDVLHEVPIGLMTTQ
ncbi:MAG: hypothetical protein ACRDYC_08430, partial [Acidimicrobiales bacterium]